MSSLYVYDKRLAQLLMVSFFLPLRLQVFVMIPVCIFFAGRDLALSGIPKPAALWPTLLFVSFYLLYLFYLPFTPKAYRPEVLFQLEQKASILLMPIVWLLISHATREIIYRQLWLFVIACAVSCFAGNLFYFMYHGAGGIPSHVVYRLFFESATGLHPTYMGMYICFSISWLLYERRWSGRLRGWLVVACFAAFFLFLFALMPKALIIALAVIVLHFLLMGKGQKERKIIVSIALLISIFITILFIPFSMQRIAEIGQMSHIGQGKSLVDNSMDMRKLIWKIDKAALEENWLAGAGPGQIPAELGKQYFLYSLMIKYPLGVFDTHNQYINQWISFGLAGILLFTAILFLHYRKAVLTRNALYLYLLVILSVTFFTENVLSNQHGVVFYAFFTSMFFYGSGKSPQV